jgi:hypothetical protein
MKQTSVLDRRAFVKVLLAAGATGVEASACRSLPAGETPAPAGAKPGAGWR